MLLTCPYCQDIAEIPTILKKFHGLPIACHACASIFFIPRAIAKNAISATLLTTTPAPAEPKAENITCQSCQFVSVAPKADHKQDAPALRCPAFHDVIIRPRARPGASRYSATYATLFAVAFGGLLGAILSWRWLYGVLPVWLDQLTPEQLTAHLVTLRDMINTQITAFLSLLQTTFVR